MFSFMYIYVCVCVDVRASVWLLISVHERVEVCSHENGNRGYCISEGEGKTVTVYIYIYIYIYVSICICICARVMVIPKHELTLHPSALRRGDHVSQARAWALWMEHQEDCCRVSRMNEQCAWRAAHSCKISFMCISICVPIHVHVHVHTYIFFLFFSLASSLFYLHSEYCIYIYEFLLKFVVVEFYASINKFNEFFNIVYCF